MKLSKLLLCLLFLFGTPIYAQVESATIEGNYIVEYNSNQAPLLFIDGSHISDYEVIVRDDYSLIPVRVITEKFGATVDWNGESRQIVIQKGLTNITLTIDGTIALVNGEAMELDYPAIIHEDLTYVPLRFITESFDATITYAPKLTEATEFYYDTNMPLTPKNSLIREFANIIIDQPVSQKAITFAEASTKVKDLCMEGLENFSEALVASLVTAGEDEKRFDSDIAKVEYEIQRMKFIDEVSRYYKYTIGAYDILFDKYTGDAYFVIHDSTYSIKKIDVNDPSLYTRIFFVG